MPVTINGTTGVSLVQDGVVTQADLAANVAGNGPAFSAYSAAAQSISQSVYTKVTFDTEEYDTNSNFASSRFTPTIAGYYQVSGGIQTSGVSFSQLVVNKNGTAYKYGTQTSALSFVTNNMSALIYMNGSTDYVELYALFGVTGNTNPGVAAVYFQGAMVRAA